LASTLLLAGGICRSAILSVLKPIPADGAPSPVIKERLAFINKPPFHTIRRPVFWHILLLAALSRLILYGVAFLASWIYLGAEGNFLATLPALWQRSDANHYVSIARNWYVNTGEDRVFLVFLPLYPIIIKLFSYIFGSAVLSGILVSLLSYAAACVLFYEVALLIGQDEDTAYHAVRYAVFFPASFFVNGAFSEGLFLLLSALFFHYLLRKKWIAAAGFGLLASFTRYYGLLLTIPYAIELSQDIVVLWRYGDFRADQSRREIKKSDKSRISDNTNHRGAAAARYTAETPRSSAEAKQLSLYVPNIRNIVKRSVPILLIPAGTGIYLIINYMVSGNFFQFLIYQREHWSQGFTFFFNNMRTLAVCAVSYDRKTSASLFVPQIICIFLFIAMMVYGVVKKFRVSFLAYLGVYYLLTISANWMLSFPRYIFGAMPIFPLMASLGGKSKAADTLMSLICIAGLVFLTIAYTCGFHVY
jgi:hypothetical protein